MLIASASRISSMFQSVSSTFFFCSSVRSEKVLLLSLNSFLGNYFMKLIS